MLDNNLGQGLDFLKVSKHVKTEVADVVLKHISVEGDFDQVDVHLRRVILAKKADTFIHNCTSNK